MGPDLSPGGSVALGVVVGLVSTCIQSIGLTLQRKSHLLEEEKEEEEYGYERRPPYRRRRWQIGMSMFLIANIVGSSIQITTLPLPVLSTLQASGLVFNTACATLVLSEPFTKYSLAGTILVAGGAVLIATFGALAEPSHNLDQLLVLLSRKGFLIWLFGTFFIVAVIIVCMWFFSRLHRRPTARVRLIRGMSYGAISGVLSAHCLLLAKSAVELLVRTIADKSNQFNRWQSWMILVFFVFLALSQLYYLHRGLKLCSTSVLYPFVFCIYNILAILDGLIYFHQTSRLSVLHACLIALGTVILLSGVVALSWRLSDEPHQNSQDQDAKSIPHRVPTPQSALAPGLGLVSVETTIGDESPYLRPADDEAALARRHDLRLSEATPLLRTSTAPMWPQGTVRPKRPSTKPRRLTLHQEQTEIWDELNDRGDAGGGPRRFFATASGHRSPYASRSPVSQRTDRRVRGRAETLPASSGPRSRSVQLPALLRNFSWGIASGNGKDRAPSAAEAEAEASRPPQPTSEDGDGYDDDDDEPDHDPADADQARSPRPPGKRRGSNSANTVAGWFKLRWWKRRWRDGGLDDGSAADGGAAPPDSSATAASRR